MSEAQAWRSAAVRFVAHLPLWPLAPLAALLAGVLIFFPSEHPFQTDGVPDFEKLPTQMNAWVIVPAYLALGVVTGLVFSVRATRPVRHACLALYSLWASVWVYAFPGRADTRHWPAWMLALCAFVAAVAVCRYWPVPPPASIRRSGDLPGAPF